MWQYDNFWIAVSFLGVFSKSVARTFKEFFFNVLEKRDDNS